MKKKKLRCPNCGTVIKWGETSCSVCHQVVKREPTEEETLEEMEEEGLPPKQFPVGKVIMVIFIVIGIVLTIKGFVEYQNVQYCTADDCGFKKLFLAGLGIILIFSASIALCLEPKK